MLVTAANSTMLSSLGKFLFTLSRYLKDKQISSRFFVLILELLFLRLKRLVILRKVLENSDVIFVYFSSGDQLSVSFLLRLRVELNFNSFVTIMLVPLIIIIEFRAFTIQHIDNIFSFEIGFCVSHCCKFAKILIRIVVIDLG